MTTSDISRKKRGNSNFHGFPSEACNIMSTHYTKWQHQIYHDKNWVILTSMVFLQKHVMSCLLMTPNDNIRYIKKKLDNSNVHGFPSKACNSMSTHDTKWQHQILHDKNWVIPMSMVFLQKHVISCLVTTPNDNIRYIMTSLFLNPDLSHHIIAMCF